MLMHEKTCDPYIENSVDLDKVAQQGLQCLLIYIKLSIRKVMKERNKL